MNTNAAGIECLGVEVDSNYDKNAQAEVEAPKNEPSSKDQAGGEESDKFHYQYGRRYHAVDKEFYSLPNDAEEVQRLGIQEMAWKLTLKGGLNLAPISEDIKFAVDMGTGTGSWAIEFAKAHPQCKVVGTDLSPIQPTKNVPSNCSFVMSNFNEEWNFTEPIDLIHGRMLALGVRPWDRFFEQAYKHLKPGGWIDLQEVSYPIGYIDDGNVNQDSPLSKFSILALEAAAKNGSDLHACSSFKEMATSQGFINVTYENPKWAVGPWQKGNRDEKRIAALTGLNTRQFVAGLAMKTLTTGLGWSEQKVHDLVAQVNEELEDPHKHYYWSMFVLCAQKPLT